ncbi:MAG: cytochrome-c peroxidase [Spirochaetia bacterium]|nr:cytochrome-c peroxidase [Spirochaetia bacterium]
MKIQKLLIIGISVSATIFLSQCGPSKEVKELMKRANETIGVIPDKMPGSESDTGDKLALGKKLYFEKALSKDNAISCNSCHNLENGGNGTDNQSFSTGVNGKKGGRNAPTVFNAGFHIAQFWDGRAENLMAQAKGPILNPVEMAMPDADAVVRKIGKMPEYAELFKKAFPGTKDPVTYDNLVSAIASFERTLKTHDKFDEFQKGNAKALNSAEMEGLKTFLDTGCTNCHNGPLVGGNSYRKLGLVNAYETRDKGRYLVTKDEADMYVFKVPSLRNVTKTFPYFHDGSISTLKDAIQKMGWHQLGKKLGDEDIGKIATFLNTLSGN